MKILVTGGAGFIGAAVTRKLVGRGDEVVVIDDESNASRDAVPNEADYIHGDVRDDALITNLPGFDAVVHLAALLDVDESREQPQRYADVNVQGTLNLLENTETERFILASSASVYGEADTFPLEESMPLRPKSTYGATKAAAESYATTYHDLQDIKVASLRFFNVYGPGQRPDSPYAGVINIFIQKFLEDEQPVIYGDGEQTRDYIYVDDLADAVVKACDASYQHEILNLASGSETSVLDIVDALQNITGKELEPRHEDPLPGDPRRSVADVQRAKDVLDFEAETSLEEGIRETLAWMQ